MTQPKWGLSLFFTTHSRPVGTRGQWVNLPLPTYFGSYGNPIGKGCVWLRPPHYVLLTSRIFRPYRLSITTHSSPSGFLALPTALQTLQPVTFFSSWWSFFKEFRPSKIIFWRFWCFKLDFFQYLFDSTILLHIFSLIELKILKIWNPFGIAKIWVLKTKECNGRIWTRNSKSKLSRLLGPTTNPKTKFPQFYNYIFVPRFKKGFWKTSEIVLLELVVGCCEQESRYKV